MAFQVFQIENLADICLVSPWEQESVLPFRGFQLSPLAFCPMQLQILADVLRERLAMWLRPLRSPSFVTPAPCECQSLCWLLCPPVGAFCQGPCLHSQPLDMPRIGKWPQVKSGCGCKITMPSRASSLPALFQALPSGESLFAKTRLGGFTPL